MLRGLVLIGIATFAWINPFVSAVGRDLDDGYWRAHHVGDLRRYSPNHLTNPVDRPGRILRRIGFDYSPDLFNLSQREDRPRSTSVARTNNLILFNPIRLTVKGGDVTFCAHMAVCIVHEKKFRPNTLWINQRSVRGFLAVVNFVS
jgi:hypothetical protein